MKFLSILLIILYSIIFIFYTAFVCDYDSLDNSKIQKRIQIVILILFILVLCILYGIEAKELGM